VDAYLERRAAGTGERATRGGTPFPVEPRHQVGRANLVVEDEQRGNVAVDGRIAAAFGAAAQPFDEDAVRHDGRARARVDFDGEVPRMPERPIRRSGRVAGHEPP